MTQKNEFSAFKKSVNEWIRDFNKKFKELDDLPDILETHEQCIDHNYEMICELRAEINTLRQEVSALRLIQLMQMQMKLKEMKG